MLDKTTQIEMIPYAPDKEVTMGRLRVTVRGRTPLLTHNPASMGMASEVGRGSRIPDAEVEAEAGCYRTENGTLALKGEAFRSSMVGKGGAASAWKGKNRTTMKTRLAHIVVVEELVEICDPRDGKPLTSYAIDARRAIVQRQGIIRRRPRFDHWQCTFTIEYDPQLATEPKLIVDILADAGGRCGVGDYRPSSGGWFGRFTIVSYALL